MTGASISVPTSVAHGISARWPERAPYWLSQVTTELAELCRRYKATPVSTFDSRYGLVVEVETDTERLVMRSSPDPDALLQSKVSQQLAVLGVGPEIREVEATESGVWTVAARVHPGYTMKNRPVSVEQLAATLQPLRAQPAPGHLPALTDWLFKRLQDDEVVDLPSRTSTAPKGERQHATELLSELTTETARLLCHGDLSSKNILMGPTGKLYLIDPRGLSGDIAYDVAVAAWKTAGNEPILSRTMRLAKLMKLDSVRVETWLTIAKTARV